MKNLTMGKIISRVKRFFLLLRTNRAQRFLAEQKCHQKIAFEDLSDGFSKMYDRLKKVDSKNQFITPCWEYFNRELEKIFLPNPPFSFLREPVIMNTMFISAGGDCLKKELAFLEGKIPNDKLKVLLEEDFVGDPLLMNREFATSHTSIHHLYSIARFLNETHCALEKVNVIVEWGGGYGNMAKIFNRLKSAPVTYVIIDTPIVSCIQWLYLATIFGRQNVNLIQNPNDTVIVGKLNLLPTCLVDRHDIKADLFISTWALSESPKHSQDFMINNHFFNAEHFLIAWHDNNAGFPDSERIVRPVVESGAITHDIEFLPGDHYAFR